jgi:hypothetical protein
MDEARRIASNIAKLPELMRASTGRRERMKLSPPSQVTFILAVLLAVLALLVKYSSVAIPVVSVHS